MIQSPRLNRFQYRTGNVHGTRPAAAYGTSITPGNNSFPAYASILAGGSITEDCYEVIININSNTTSAAARDTLVTLGIDTSGGTTYVDWIPNLLASCAAAYGATLSGSGVWYRFPLFVKSGSQIAAKASVNNATVGTLRVAIWLLGKPTAPEMIRYGTYCDSFGEVTASSRGTTITAGTTSDGTLTALGSAESRPHWHWQCGFGVNDTTMSQIGYHADLAIGSSTTLNVVALEDVYVGSAGTESAWQDAAFQFTNTYYESGGASNVYGRLQCTGGADAALSMIGYGVGG